MAGLPTAAALLGHSRLDTVRLYAQPDVAALERALDLLDASWGVHHGQDNARPFSWPGRRSDLSPSPVQPWSDLMGSWNALILGHPADVEQVPPDLAATGWLGRGGASDHQLMQAEQRLGARLPPSYRDFLAFSNGWQSFGGFVTNPGPLLSIEEVDWVRAREADWVRAMAEPEDPDHPSIADDAYFVYGEEQQTYNFRSEYVPHLLQISAMGDVRLLLLNPRVRFPDGEWEAWDYAAWYPGVVRYRSFWEMMETMYRDAVTMTRE